MRYGSVCSGVEATTVMHEIGEHTALMEAAIKGKSWASRF